jgi:hypothetical protein
MADPNESQLYIGVAEDGETFFVNAVLEGENEVKFLQEWDCLMTGVGYEL